MALRPIRLYGLWDEGFALDLHSIKSIPLGENANGQMQFDTTRTIIGYLIYQLKYHDDYDKVDEIMNLVVPFLDCWPAMRHVSFVIPAPSSKPRAVQPVHLLAERIAGHLHVGWSADILKKKTSTELKGTSRAEKSQRIAGSIIRQRSASHEHNLLLVDDLFQTGTTLSECVRVLREDPLIKDIYVLCMTKTKEMR